MAVSANWTDEDTRKAETVWAEYQRRHDVSALRGQAVGIDPLSGRVWFGRTGVQVVDSARAEGLETPLLLLRVGFPYYQRKGGRR